MPNGNNVELDVRVPFFDARLRHCCPGLVSAVGVGEIVPAPVAPLPRRR
jgi:hypothetical protein